MQRFFSILLFCGLLPATAAAQGVGVMFGAPAIHWTVRPPMAVFAPGMWVVEDSPDEVFFYDGWYWTQQNDHWYRSRDHRGHWGEVDRGRVPVSFYAQEPGHYRHFRGEGGAGPGPGAFRREPRPARPAYAPDRPQARPAKARDRKDEGHGRPGGDRGGNHGDNGRGNSGHGNPGQGHDKH